MLLSARGGELCLVKPGIRHRGKYVGPVRGDGYAVDDGVEHAPDSRDGALHAHPSLRAGHQVEAAGRAAREPVETFHGTGAEALPEAGGDREGPGHHRLRRTSRGMRGLFIGPATDQPGPPGSVGQLPVGIPA
jgi:hypothetical protein